MPEDTQPTTDTSLMSGMSGIERTTSLATPPQPSITDPGKPQQIPGAPAPIPPSTQGTGTPSAPPEGYDDAVTFLRETGTPDAVIQTTDKEALVAWAAELASQAETEDSAGTNQVTDLLERLEARLGASDTAKETATPKSATEVTGEKDGDPRIATLERQLQYLTSVMESRAIDTWVERSKGDFPAIVEREMQDKVTKLAGVLINAGEETSVDRALDTATKVIMAQGGTGKTALSRRASLAKLRSNGSLTPPVEAQTPNTVVNMTADQIREKQLELVTTGKSSEGFELGKQFTASKQVGFDGIF